MGKHGRGDAACCGVVIVDQIVHGVRHFLLGMHVWRCGGGSGRGRLDSCSCCRDSSCSCRRDAVAGGGRRRRWRQGFDLDFDGLGRDAHDARVLVLFYVWVWKIDILQFKKCEKMTKRKAIFSCYFNNHQVRYIGLLTFHFLQCCGSMTFWYRSRSGDPYL